MPVVGSGLESQIGMVRACLIGRRHDSCVLSQSKSNVVCRLLTTVHTQRVKSLSLQRRICPYQHLHHHERTTSALPIPLGGMPLDFRAPRMQPV